MIELFISATLVVAGVIHLLPLTGVSGAGRLEALYGIAVCEPNLAILMRHRAVVLGLIGAVFILAAVQPPLRTLAFAVGLVTVGSFLGIAWSMGDYNAKIGRVVSADVLALACLILELVAHLMDAA